MSEATTQQSPSIAKLLPALIRARAAFPSLLKDSENPHFRSRYADLAAVLEACDRPLGANDLAILQIPVWDSGTLVLHTTLAHSSGEWIRATYPVAADPTRPQVTGASLTYARRYTYMAVAGIAPEDDDGEAASGRGNGQITRPVNPIAQRNQASHENRGGPVARNQPREAPPAWGGNGANGHANGHTKPEPPAREIGERVPTSGKGLWRWAAEIERLQGPGLIKHIQDRAKGRPGWAGKIIDWTPAQVSEAFEDAEAALELIYDPHADTGDDYDDAEHERDYN